MDEHQTDDIYLAAYLRYQGHEIRNSVAQRGNGGYVVFGFARTDDLLARCNEYASRTGTVEPRAFVREVSNIRSLIDQARRESYEKGRQR